MEIGIYNLKYPFRKVISFVLPLMKNVEPDTISWSLLPIGVVTAVVYWYAVNGSSWWYVVGALLILLRFIVGTLDGLVATAHDKSTLRGAMVNRLAPELCDVMFVTVLVAARPDLRFLGLGVLVLAWFTSFAGLLGGVSGLPMQTVGPVGQPDRMVALVVASLGAFLGARFGWSVDFVAVLFWWLVIGGVVTVILRLVVQFAGARAATAEASNSGR